MTEEELLRRIKYLQEEIDYSDRNAQQKYARLKLAEDLYDALYGTYYE